MKKFKVNRPLYVLETRKENNDAVEAKVVESPIKMVEEVKKSEETSNRSNFWKFVAVMAVVVIAIAIFAIGCDKTADEDSATDKNAMFLQVAGDNDKNRVDNEFAAKYAAATKDAANLSKAQEKLLLENAANNAQRLAIWANAFGLYDNPNDVMPLLTSDKKYLSEKGKSLYYKLEGALDTCVIEEGKAPSNGFNSGVSDGTYVAAENSGISGDRKAIVATTLSGEKVYIMVRCGNVVTPNKPNIPTGPTDELESKDPTKDVLANDDVDDWKKNSNGEKAVAEPEDFQADPVKDAADAADDAAVAADKAADAADDARDEAVDSGAGVVDSGTGYGEVEDPTTIDPNW